jgi:hypothetical protein
MTRAKDLARKCCYVARDADFDPEQEFIRAINEALEWAAQQAESEPTSTGPKQNEAGEVIYECFGPKLMRTNIARSIRAGKSE